MWLCLHLPRYALEAPARYLPMADASVAVVTATHGRQCVIAANDKALQDGVYAGQWLTAARARVPGLLTWERDARAESAWLQQLAVRCLRVTSHVHLPAPPPDPGAGRLLLEIGGSLRLFGGLRPLQQFVRGLLDETGHDARMGTGRTPMLAMLRARAAAHGHGRTRTHALPLRLLELPEKTLDSLATAGLVDIDGVLNLPRDGLARRYQPACVDYLDRLTGRKPDPRPPLSLPRTFDAGLELPAEVADSRILRFVFKQLVDDLGTTLREADAAIASLRLLLKHAELRASRVDLSFSMPTRNAARMTDLLAERIDGLALPAPVRALRLTSGRFLSHDPGQQDLFAERTRDGSAWNRLRDRLQARLGEAVLRQPQCRPDHRPERASRLVALGSESGEPAATQRPTWLLSAPQQLADPPRLLSGPERIESGWWDVDQCRDYYIGRDRSGRCVWVYREARAPRRWFLHGVFG